MIYGIPELEGAWFGTTSLAYISRDRGSKFVWIGQPGTTWLGNRFVFGAYRRIACSGRSHRESLLTETCKAQDQSSFDISRESLANTLASCGSLFSLTFCPSYRLRRVLGFRFPPLVIFQCLQGHAQNCLPQLLVIAVTSTITIINYDFASRRQAAPEISCYSQGPRNGAEPSPWQLKVQHDRCDFRAWHWRRERDVFGPNKSPSHEHFRANREVSSEYAQVGALCLARELC